MKKNNKRPLVSILCETYNHEHYIRDALDGFIKQKTHFNFEVLICDDASTDKTPNIIKEYVNKYPEIIKPVYQKTNQWSKGIAIGKSYNMPRILGKYVAVCEGDDYWIDEYKLQKQVDYLEKNKDCSLCFHPVKVIYEGKNRSCIFPTPKYRFYKSKLELEDLLKHNFIQTNSVMYRWMLTEKLNQFPAEKILPGDYYLHLLHARKGKIGFINETMSVYRRHSGSMWDGANLKRSFYQKNWSKLLNFYIYLTKIFHLETQTKQDKIIRKVIYFNLINKNYELIDRIHLLYKKEFLYSIKILYTFDIITKRLKKIIRKLFFYNLLLEITLLFTIVILLCFYK